MDVLARMLEAAVVTLREGIEAALAVAVVVASLRATGRTSLVRVVGWAVAAAGVASVAGAVVVHRVGLDPENEVWEGTALLVAAGLVASLVLWMRRAGRRIRGRVVARVAEVTRPGRGRRAALGLFAFTFLMVFREGVETALFLGALSGTVGANPLYNALGGGLGLLLALVFGALLVQGAVRVDVGRFFRVTEAVLLLLVAKLVASGLHEFFEVGRLPASETVLAVVGLLTRDSTSVLVLVLLVAVPAAMLLAEAWTARAPLAAPDETAAEGRRRRADVRAARRWSAGAGLAGLALASLLAVSGIATARGFDPAPVPVPLAEPAVRLPLGAVAAAPITKYEVAVDGVNVRLLARRVDDRVVVTLDACAICPLRGYHLVGEQLVCGNCGAPVAADTLGVAGGCNPIPVPSEVVDDHVVVRTADLRLARARFAHR